MRHVLFLVLGLALGALGARAVVARAGDDAPPVAPAPAPEAAPGADVAGSETVAMTRYVRDLAALRAELEYLRAREASLSKYVLGLSGATTNLRTNVSAARREGFEAAAVPASSRATVLRALEQLGGDLTGALPAPTTAESSLRRKADEARRAADWK